MASLFDYITIYDIAFLVVFAVFSILAWFTMRHFHIWPFKAKDKHYFGIFDEARNFKWHYIDKDQIQVLGDYEYFYWKKEVYHIKQKNIFRYNNCSATAYRIHDPRPLTMENSTENEMTASETKEITNTKVVFDLLRFTLSNIESAYLIIAIISLIVGCIGVFMGYENLQSINAVNHNFNILFHYLYPNGIPSTG